MKKKILSMLLVVAMILTSVLPSMSVQAENADQKNYTVTLPDGYDDDHSYPVIYVLPQNGYAKDTSGIAGKLKTAMENGTSTPMIIVEPSFAEGENLYDVMDKIIEEVDKEYNTIADANHRAVVGTGVGGYLAYVLGLTEDVAVKDVTPEEGGSEDVIPEEGGSEDVTPEEGGSEDVTPEEGGSEDVTPEEGGSEDVTPEEGGSEDVTPEEGGSEDVTPKEGGSEDVTPEEGGNEDVTPEETAPEIEILTAPKNFKYIASVRGDFVSEKNPWYAAYGDVYTYMKTIGAGNLSNFYTYIDSPVEDAWADMKGSTHDIGQMIITNKTDASACEFTTRLGAFTDEFLTESVSRVARRVTEGVLGNIVNGTVSLKNTILSKTENTFDVDYTVNTTEAIKDFSSVTETMNIIVKVLDPSSGEVLASNSTAVEVGAEAKGTLVLDKNVKGTSATVALSAKVLGAEFEIATATALNVRDTVVDGDYQLVDLMGDWNFHYLNRGYMNNGPTGYDAVKEDIESGAYKKWTVVQPGLAWWTEGFGDLQSLGYGDYGFLGEGWYVKEFDVPAGFDAQELYLSVGNLDDRGQAFINGKLVGETGMDNGVPTGESAWEEYSYYKVNPDDINIGGTNTIAVRCYNDGWGGGGWYAGPIALYSKSAFEADESTASFFTEYEFDSEYAASAQGKEGTVKNKYLVALPESYGDNPDKYYPTVYLMHQYNSTHKSYITDSIDKLLRNAAKEGLLDEMIVVVPNSAEESWWRGDWMKMVSEELVPLIDSTYRTIDDARYRFTAGCSMGGQGAYGVALQNPDLFSGAISFFGAFSYGRDASANTIVENESAEYLDNFAMYFICGNQDLYQFGDPAVELHQQLLAKDVDHEFFIENGGHDSPFYVPYFVDGVKYVRDNMYKSSSAVDDYLSGEITVNGEDVLKVEFEASRGITKYFNSIPDSSYTKNANPDLSIPLTVTVEQNGKVVFEAVERDFSISKTERSDFFKYDLSEHVALDEYYKVTFTASIFDRVVVLDTYTAHKLGVKSAKLSSEKVVYTGKTNIPSITVINEKGNKLVKGKDYKCTIYDADGNVVESPKAVGVYTIKVSYIGNYKGTTADKLEYTIIPKAVTNMKAELSGDYDDVKVSWKKSSGADGYYVYYKKSSASKYSSYKVVTGTSVTIKNLTDGTKYSFKVVPYFGEDKIKSTASTIKTTVTLKKVTGVKVSKNKKKVTVSWKNIDGETGYQISRSTKKSGVANVKSYKGASLESKKITVLSSKKYYYKVRAYKKNSDGKTVYGPWSTAVLK